jgi:serpin B
VANRIFGEKTVAYEKDYLGQVERLFAAPLESMDFKGDPEASRVRINAWVADETKDKIRDLLPPRSIDASTRLALVNAVYFKSQWMFPFEENRTRDGDFHVAKGKTTSAKMMTQTSYFDHAVHADDGLAVLQMPYEGRELGMVVLLPEKKDGLPALEASLDAEHFEKWVGGLSGKRVTVQLPKFEIAPGEAMLLSPVLQGMGIEKMFDAKGADLTGIAPAKEQLYIAEGYHKAFIEVDESGTEAAAATAMVAVAGAAPPSDPPPSFIADHPFVYMIRDLKTGTILFIGRVADPS